MKFIKKHKVSFICLGVLLVLFVLAFFGIKGLVYPDDSANKYGNRLDGIENVPISDEVVNKIKEEFKSKEGVSECTYTLTGRIIKIVLTVDGTVSVTSAKSYSDIIIANLSSEQKNFYDIQYYVWCSDENDLYPIIGSKHKSSLAFVWTEKKTGVSDAE